MTALTANKFSIKDLGAVRLHIPVADNVHIYKGSIVCYDTNGYGNIGADTSGFVFAGIAIDECDNTLANHTAGGKFIDAAGRTVESDC